MIIAITECFDVCSQPNQWPSSAVLYNGPLNVQGNSSAPQKGHYQDFTLTLPQYQPGGAVLSVAHSFDAELAVRSLNSAVDYADYATQDGSFDPLFEYTNIQINIQ